jgi:BlaI family penicillinase repressor
MSKPSLELTSAEWSIMKAIWKTEPCTAPGIQERLFKSTGWTYSTVRTLMDRLVAKGVLKAKKDGKMTLYSSLLTQLEAQRGEICYTLKHAFNGAFTPMLQCLLDTSDLDVDQLAELEALIKKKKRPSK